MLRRILCAAGCVWFQFCAAASLTPTSAAEATLYFSQGGGIWRASVDAPVAESWQAGFDVQGLATGRGLVVWTDIEPRVPITPTGVTRAATLGRAGAYSVATDLPQPSGVSVDAAAGTVYWSDLEESAIYRRKLDGTGTIERVLGGTASISAIHSIDLDLNEQKLYFGFVNPLIDGLFPGSIARINLDGSGFEHVVSGLTEPWGVAVDPIGGSVYWTDTPFEGEGIIRRAPLDGGDVEDLVSGLMRPRGIALDSRSGEMFWADAGAGAIQRASLDGSNPSDVLTNLDEPRAIAISVIPEPATLILALVGLAAVVVRRTLGNRP